MVDTAAALAKNIIQVPQVQGTADIFRGFMVSLYVKGKENGHVQAYAPTGGCTLFYCSSTPILLYYYTLLLDDYTVITGL